MKIGSKEVSFEINGQKQIGTLFLGKRDFLYLETNQSFFQSATLQFEIHCISTKQHFILIDSVTRNGNIYPLYVIEDFLQKDEYSDENKPAFRNGENRQTGIQDTALAA